MNDETGQPYPLDREHLINGSVTLYFKPQLLEEAKEWFLHQNYEIVTFNCDTWKSQEDFHADVSQKLKFPNYYGCNLDALNDCLSDIGHSSKHGTIFLFLRFDAFNKRSPKFAWDVLDIIASHSYRFLLESYKLIVLVQSDDPKLSIDPIGAHPVLWNSREWLNKNRGL